MNIIVEPNPNTTCNCAYLAHFSSSEDAIIYYHTLTYKSSYDPSGYRQYQKLLANQTFTWSSENIIDGVCVPTYLDKFTAFVAISGCDNIYKSANWAIDYYAVSVEMLCK